MSGADARPIAVPFSKWHGAANDYVFVELDALDARAAAALREDAPAVARRVAARRTGIGSDGLVLLEREDGIDLRLVMHNADGSRGRVCGTALRCAAVGLHTGAFARGARRGARELLLASDAGIHAAECEAGAARVSLGVPVFDAARIPLDLAAVEVVAAGGAAPWQVRLVAAAATWEGLVLSMGNPHLVLPLDADPDAVDVAGVGPALEAHRAFPERANVSFVRLDERGALAQRTFERGSGETASCGSGAAAAVVALVHLGALPRARAHRVRMPGGVLEVTYTLAGEVWLGGPTERVCEGTFALRA